MNPLDSTENLTENIEGNIQVNGVAYIATNTANYDGTGSTASDFLGYTQDYDNRYTATITLTNGGLIRKTNKAEAEDMYISIFTGKGTPNQQQYRISVESVEPVTTYRLSLIHI